MLTTRRWYSIIGAVGLLGIAACGDAPASVSTTAVEQRVATERWAAGGFTESGGAILAGYPSGGALLADGRTAVADPGQGAILLLGPDGDFAAALGTRGFGPGEFQQLDRIGTLGDTALWATDNASSWITVFDLAQPDSSWTISARERQLPSTDWSVEADWLLADGTVLGRPLKATGRGDPSAVETIPLVVLQPGGGVELIEMVSNVSPRQRSVAVPNGLPMTTPQPLTAVPLFGVSRDGAWLYLLDRAPTTSSEGVMSFRRYTSSGELLGEADLPYDALPVGDTVMDWLRGFAQAFEDQLPPQMGIRADAVLEATWIPEWLPPAQAVLADEEGLWVQREQWSDGLWQRFGLDGSLLYEVRLPDGLVALAGTDTQVLGWQPDSLNVAVVRLYDIIESGR